MYWPFSGRERVSLCKQIAIATKFEFIQLKTNTIINSIALRNENANINELQLTQFPFNACVQVTL